MTPALLENESNATTFMFDEVEWPEQTAFRCHLCIVPEDDGTVSALVLNLPGAGSCGTTEEEAITRAREAIAGVIESHTAAGEPIPWQDVSSSEIPHGAKQKWILVNA